MAVERACRRTDPADAGAEADVYGDASAGAVREPAADTTRPLFPARDLPTGPPDHGGARGGFRGRAGDGGAGFHPFRRPDAGARRAGSRRAAPGGPFPPPGGRVAVPARLPGPAGRRAETAARTP